MSDVLSIFWKSRMHKMYSIRSEVSKLEKAVKKLRILHRLILKSERLIVFSSRNNKRYAAKLREERSTLLRKIRKNHQSIDVMNLEVTRHTTEVSDLIKLRETIQVHLSELQICRTSLQTTSRNFRLLSNRSLSKNRPKSAANCVKAEQECLEVLLNVNLEYNGSRARLNENSKSIERNILAWGQLDEQILQAERQNADMGGRLWSLKREYASCEAHVSCLRQQVHTSSRNVPILPFFSPILYNSCCFRSKKSKKRVSGPNSR